LRPPRAVVIVGPWTPGARDRIAVLIPFREYRAVGRTQRLSSRVTARVCELMRSFGQAARAQAVDRWGADGGPERATAAVARGRRRARRDVRPSETAAPDDWRTLVLQYLPLARKVARRCHRAAPGVDFDDFEGAAFEGLVQAAQRWRPELSRDGKFGRWAAPRILGAIRDWQRSSIVVTGTRWQRDLDRAAGLEPMAIIPVSYEAIVDDAAAQGRPLPDELRIEHAGYAETERRLALAALVEHVPLTSQERHVIRARLAGRTQDAIGEEVGLTGSRICMLEGVAVRALREAARSDVAAA